MTNTDTNTVTDSEVEAYIQHVERIENILLVLDDALECCCSPAERLFVIEAVASVLNVEPDCIELWQHVATLESQESGEKQ